MTVSEKRGRCDLSARVRNGRDRLADSGATKTKKIEAFGRMDVIEADARLERNIYNYCEGICGLCSVAKLRFKEVRK